ncbi:toll/interleukin-1 receptor domain-containing protein [Nitrospira sp. NS4]|uniref:toll/interleukin-1 receptor domain-containing protein n=1 Tax=Nitrospira sp. NS4 TaxID=3414498 RepID=UPI003C2F2897
MKIFLCYPSVERPAADSIRLALVAEGHEVFFDRSDLPPGGEYHARINGAIESSDLFIFLVSPESLAKGRYTLSELDIAQARWTHPAGHVLPVLVQPTPIKDLPAYLRAVTLLEPNGDVAADVARAVRQLSSSGPRTRWLIGAGMVLAVAGACAFVFVSLRESAQEIAALLAVGRTQEEAHDYAGAWNTYDQALQRVDGRPLTRWFDRKVAADVANARTDAAMRWLGDVHKPSEKKWADIVDPLLPALDAAAAVAEGPRKADILAHRGWADFLRTRDGRADLNPAVYYQRAIDLDPANAYAHAMWGHWILWSGGTLPDADGHFRQALAGGEHRSYVRRTQFSALQNRQGDESALAQLRAANDMRRAQEVLDASFRRRLFSVFDSKLRPPRDPKEFLAQVTSVVPAGDLVATYLWLFDDREFPFPDQRGAPYYLALLQEAAGDDAAAVKTLQAFRATLTPNDRSFREGADRALVRLSKAAPVRPK